MKNFITLFLSLLFLAFLLIRCGKETEEMKQAMDVLKNLPEKAQKMEASMNEAETRQAERRKRGDTLSLPYKKLQEYLPKSIAGFKEPKLSGESMNMGGFSMSQAEAEYWNEDETNKLKISLTDYNENYGLLSGLAFWMTGYSKEDDNGYERTFDPGVKYVWALEKYNKNSKEAEVTLAIGWRFWLNITAQNQTNTDFVRSVAKNFDLKSLSQM
jgi:hypothetical protein